MPECYSAKLKRVFLALKDNITQNMLRLIRWYLCLKCWKIKSEYKFTWLLFILVADVVNQSWFVFKKIEKLWQIVYDSLLLLWKTVLKKNYNNSNDNHEW